jgi:signal transduction histidine kinase
MVQIIHEAQLRLRDQIQQSDAEITLQEVAAWPTAMGYAPWVEEVWANYLSHALKYGGKPPRIEIGASSQAGGMVRFWVRDHGPGLSPEDQSRLFTPFTRLDQVRAQGHGLGLSIVQRIARSWGVRWGSKASLGRAAPSISRCRLLNLTSRPPLHKAKRGSKVKGSAQHG